MTFKPWSLLLIVTPTLLLAQQKTDLQQILERMDRLEQENRALAAEVHSLRDALAAPAPAAPALDPTATRAPASAPLEERAAVQERRTEELEQIKVGTAQKLPVTLTGMVLFNAFVNSSANGGFQDPFFASLSDSRSGSGASLSQSIIGLTFWGPRLLSGAQVNGDLQLDLWGGSASSLNHLVRLRVATLRMDWKNQSIVVGQDKPIISPRDPSSLAQVAFSPLTAAGNPWLWQPQARFEQRFAWGDTSGFRAQAGVYESSEPVSSAGTQFASTLTTGRPALEGRFMFWKTAGKDARFEVAPGFHAGETHVAGVSVPSRLFSLDWLIQPSAKLQWTGMFFTGRNAAGIGALRQGFTIFSNGVVRDVGTAGGWTQLSYLVNNRLTFNAYGGQESNAAADLLSGQITRNLAYAGNAVYRLGPNVLLGFEASQVRTKYLGLSTRMANHYDLALAYLF